jgi:hypothetical protein
MTSTHSSSQTFDKEGWIQQKIKEVQERCGAANSGKAENKQCAEVCQRVVGALGAIAMRPSESLTLYTASCTLYGLAISSRSGWSTQSELTEESIRTIREISGMTQQPVEENNTDAIGIAA